MSVNQTTILAVLGLFTGMAALYVAGHRVAQWRARRGLRRDPDSLTGGALFALLGLLIAFSFSGSVGRLETRRQLHVSEVNAIGTAWLRLDLMPAESQPELRDLMREYCEVRGDAYLSLLDREANRIADERTQRLQQQIWRSCVAATADPDHLAARMLVLPAMNQMIDLTTARWIAARTHVPWVVLWTIFAIALFCAWLAGANLREPVQFGWSNALGLAGVTAMILYVMLDIEIPRVGLVNLDDYNDLLVALRDSMR